MSTPTCCIHLDRTTLGAHPKVWVHDHNSTGEGKIAHNVHHVKCTMTHRRNSQIADHTPHDGTSHNKSDICVPIVHSKWHLKLLFCRSWQRIFTQDLRNQCSAVTALYRPSQMEQTTAQKNLGKNDPVCVLYAIYSLPKDRCRCMASVSMRPLKYLQQTYSIKRQESSPNHSIKPENNSMYEV